MIKTMLFSLGLSCLILQSASAQTKPVTTTGTIDSLLQAGYDIKSVNFIPAAQATEIFGANYTATTAETLITLQKGKSVAVCNVDLQHWTQLADATMTDNARCYIR